MCCHFDFTPPAEEVCTRDGHCRSINSGDCLACPFNTDHRNPRASAQEGGFDERG